MAVFDRTWYGRVLVERVEGIVTREKWERGYDEIVNFERRSRLEGMVLIKLWMHISDEEQLHRFKSRRDDALKSWKLTDEDWRNREKRKTYQAAAEEMFERTDHSLGRWYLIEGENKRYARVKVLNTVIDRIQEGMRRQGIEPPPSKGIDFDR